MKKLRSVFGVSIVLCLSCSMYAATAIQVSPYAKTYLCDMESAISNSDVFPKETESGYEMAKAAEGKTHFELRIVEKFDGHEFSIETKELLTKSSDGPTIRSIINGWPWAEESYFSPTGRFSIGYFKMPHLTLGQDLMIKDGILTASTKYDVFKREDEDRGIVYSKGLGEKIFMFVFGISKTASVKLSSERISYKHSWSNFFMDEVQKGYFDFKNLTFHFETSYEGVSDGVNDKATYPKHKENGTGTCRLEKTEML